MFKFIKTWLHQAKHRGIYQYPVLAALGVDGDPLEYSNKHIA